ncbi:DUF4230 domain-containing protein [Streptomyces sp. NPDC092296]|uniref:DUF4230 domain-containing protein n=1 Tax=Streptomyces sp. NPDC092296 TaxID=3366012 RepID=UPI0038004B22
MPPYREAREAKRSGRSGRSGRERDDRGRDDRGRDDRDWDDRDWGDEREPARRPRGGYRRERGRVPWYVALPVTLAVIVAAFLAAVRLDWLPGLPDLFGTETKDRSGPAVLKSIQDMSRYQAATGNYQVIVDLDKDAKFLPDAVRGSRTLYVGAGAVGAYVDLGKVGADAVTVSADRRSAVLKLPHAKLDAAALDAKHSYVFTKERGLLDRFGDFFGSNPGNDQELNVLATQKIQDAAEQSDLDKRAEENTRAMLTGLLRSLGFTSVEVRFQ